jgi:hypothetical protein
MKAAPLVAVLFLSASTFVSAALAGNVTYTFDSGLDGFLNSGSGATISWVASGGNPGGYIQDTYSCDCGGGGVGLAISTPNLHITAADYGDILQFDIAAWYIASGAVLPPSLINEHVFLDGTPNLVQPLSLSVPSGSTPVWNHVSMLVGPPGWTYGGNPADASQVQNFLAGNPAVTIYVEDSFSSAANWEFGLALDNFSLSSATPEPATVLPVAAAIALCGAMLLRRRRRPEQPTPGTPSFALRCPGVRGKHQTEG